MRSALRGSVAGMRTHSRFVLAASALVAVTAGAQTPPGGRLTIDQLIQIGRRQGFLFHGDNLGQRCNCRRVKQGV